MIRSSLLSNLLQLFARCFERRDRLPQLDLFAFEIGEIVTGRQRATNLAVGIGDWRGVDRKRTR